jgi:hypothetical protein
MPVQVATYNEYEQKINANSAGGGTSFGAAFEWINQYTQTHPGIKDISIIFFTDGLDGGRDFTAQQLTQLQNTCTINEIASRYLTIGFSKGHDAVFLNKIA